jgi:hypothetical protein
MDTHADPSEIGRALASVRWSDEGRIRASAATLLERAELTDSTRLELEQLRQEADGDV